jgi:hypothetical protein
MVQLDCPLLSLEQPEKAEERRAKLPQIEAMIE